MLVFKPKFGPAYGVGIGVAVGGTEVAVGGTEVAVGGTEVAVGGTEVAVGGTEVAVGGTGVAVGGTDVAVGAAVGDSDCVEAGALLSLLHETSPNNVTPSVASIRNRLNFLMILTPPKITGRQYIM